MAKKKRKTKAGKALKKVTKAVGKTAKAIAKEVKKGATITALLPFALPMATILKAKKIKPEKNISKLAQQFHAVVIEKASSYEIVEPEHLMAEVATSIISAIINFFKQLKQKKDSGEKLTKTEEKAVELADKAIDDVIEPVSETIKSEAKEEMKIASFTPLIIIIVILLLLSMKKKK